MEPRNERIRDVPRGQQPTRRVAVDVLATLSFTVRSLSLSVSRNQKAQTSTNKGAPPPSCCPCLEIETNERSHGFLSCSFITSFLHSFLFRLLIANLFPSGKLIIRSWVELLEFSLWKNVLITYIRWFEDGENENAGKMLLLCDSMNWV